MPSVQVSESTFRLVPLPRVCVKTGIPTADVLTIKGSAAPGWSWVMIVFGFLPWLFASLASSKSYEIQVPMQAAVWRRHRRVRRAAFVLFVVGVTLAIIATTQGRQNSAFLLFPAFVGLAVYAGNEWFNTIGVHLSRDGGLLLTRVHPEFERALLDLTAREPRGSRGADHAPGT
ncbi:hypothetical protein [Pedococcus sp. P5_B7]